jgi:putative copper export protein
MATRQKESVTRFIIHVITAAFWLGLILLPSGLVAQKLSSQKLDALVDKQMWLAIDELSDYVSLPNDAVNPAIFSKI